MPIRFHLDEHLGFAIAAALRRRGIDVTTTLEAGLERASDEEQLAYVTAAGRVLITRDKGFLRRHAAGQPHAGIGFWHSKRQDSRQLVRSLTLLWRSATAEELRGLVSYL